MNKRIKLLSVGKKKAKQESLRNWEKTVGRYAPDMYDLFYSGGERDTLSLIDRIHPEIVLLLPSILQDNLHKGLLLVEKIRQLDSNVKIFVNMGLVDEEQETMDAYIANGAYKCYSVPFIMDTLFHDMYVALNVE